MSSIIFITLNMAYNLRFHHSQSRSSDCKWRLYFRVCLLPVSIHDQSVL